MRKLRTAVAGLLIASLFPLMAPAPAVEAQVIPLPLPSISVPKLPVPLPSSIPLPLPKPLPSEVRLPQPGQPIIIPQPSPVPVPGPTRTVVVEKDGTRTITVTRTVPGPIRTVLVPTPVPTPVPGPTKTVISEKLTPGQERVVEKRIQAEQIKFGIAGLIAGFLVTFTIVCLVAYRFFRKGELHGLRLLRDSI